MMQLIKTAFLVVLILGTSTLGLSQKQKALLWKYTSTGRPYTILRHDKNAKQVGMYDFVFMNISYSVSRSGLDSVIFSSEQNLHGQTMSLQIIEPTYKADIMEGLVLLSEKDSAIFKVNADSFFLKSVRLTSVPPFIKSGELITFNVGIKEVSTLEQLQAKEAENQRLQEELMKTQSEKEIEQLQTYLAAQGHTAITPDEKGLYVVSLGGATDVPCPTSGAKVQVHYTGRLLNGQVFDSSVERNQPFSFVLGQGQVIKGWDAGIAKLHPGEKAILAIPSWMAYGARGVGSIPANSPLIFEVQLISYE